MTSMADVISEYIDRHFERETEFLAELVKVPSDNPPGDCAPHAKRARDLLQQLGLTVETHPVPAARVQAAGMKSITNLVGAMASAAGRLLRSTRTGTWSRPVWGGGAILMPPPSKEAAPGRS
jgi:acetylornithine deacetylase/succinyl-diaminopimelate desuccinylase-like protein